MPEEREVMTFSDWVNDYLKKNPIPTVAPERQLRGQDLTLDQWLKVFFEEPERLNDLSRYDFPSNEHLEEFIQRIDEFSENFIYKLLFKLVPRTGSHEITDMSMALTTLQLYKSGDQTTKDHLEKVNYLRQVAL